MSKPSGAIDMTQGKPINLMLRFALPMMIGSIFQSLYSMVDSAVLGRFVGSHALAAIGATTSTTGLILLLATGVTSAISIVLSQYVGANDTDRVRKGIVASGWITLLLGVVLGLISIFAARPLMQLLKTPEDVIDMSVLYIQIVCGCGNIYANEALFDARIHPTKPADRLSRPQCARLLEAVRKVLSSAIEAGGSRIAPSLMPRDSRDAVMLHVLAISFAVRPFSRFLTSIILAIYEVLI